MNKTLETFVVLVVKFLVENVLAKYLPANLRPYLEKLEVVVPLVGKAIAVANEVKGADNAEKKAVASKHLLSLLQESDLDIPGEADLQVCELLVEGVYQALKGFRLAK